jgi:diguanylate cyclase (GGDEF)-like protein
MIIPWEPAPLLSWLGAVLAAALLFALLWPNRSMKRIQGDRALLRWMAETVRLLDDEDREHPIRTILVERDDEIGDLSRALHHCLVHAGRCRRSARALKRDFEDRLERETRKATARLERDVLRDPLTGLGNRRALEGALPEIAAAGASGGEVVAVVVDLDGFKQVNDLLGHSVGDRCLEFLGELLHSNIRREDVAIRLGGDEFVILMPDVSLDDARRVARRLTDLYAQMPWAHRSVPRPTISAGFAHAPASDLTSLDELLRQADAAMYRDKSARKSAA